MQYSELMTKLGENMHTNAMLGLALLLASSASLAARSPVEEFVGSAVITFETCRLKASIENLKNRTDGGGSLAEVQGCIAKAKADAVPQFKSAKAVLSRNKDGTTILKDFYAYWATSISALTESRELGPQKESGWRSARLNWKTSVTGWLLKFNRD